MMSMTDDRLARELAALLDGERLLILDPLVRVHADPIAPEGPPRPRRRVRRPRSRTGTTTPITTTQKGEPPHVDSLHR